MMEQKATAHLGYESNVRGEYLEELENIQESKAKKREQTLTKEYARLKGRIRNEMIDNEVSLKTVNRRILLENGLAAESKRKSEENGGIKRFDTGVGIGPKSDEVLFDGIRD